MQFLRSVNFLDWFLTFCVLSYNRSEKSSDRTEQAEKSELTDNTEKDETFLIEIYNMSAKK